MTTTELIIMLEQFPLTAEIRAHSTLSPDHFGIVSLREDEGNVLVDTHNSCEYRQTIKELIHELKMCDHDTLAMSHGTRDWTEIKSISEVTMKLNNIISSRLDARLNDVIIYFRIEL